MEAALNIFSYLQGGNNSSSALYPTYPDIDHGSFKNHKWVDLYGKFKEAIPPKMPEPRGKDIGLRMYVYSDHDVDKSTLRSRTWLLIYTNMYLIQRLSKNQPTIEMSVFVSEFVEMNHGMEKIRGL